MTKGNNAVRLAVCLIGFILLLLPAIADEYVTVTANPGARQTFQGFGCSEAEVEGGY